MSVQPVQTRLHPPLRSFLIADIRGYTAYTARHGNLAASRLTGEFARVAAEGVEAWCGDLVELRGDEALAAFESPRLALQAAVELQDAFADEVASRPSLPLRVGIGIDAGEAVPVGSGYRGAPLNLAARLCGVSGAGEIHASVAAVNVAGPIEGLVFDTVANLDLKGVGHHEQAYRVSAREPMRRGSRADFGTPTPETHLPALLVAEEPLAGRRREMRWLGWHWRRSRHGHGRIVTVSGAAGVGKTRLVAELAAQVVAGGGWVAAVSGAERPSLSAEASVEAARQPGLLVLDDLATVSPEWLDDLAALRTRHKTVGLLLVLVLPTVDPSVAGGALRQIAPQLHQLRVEPLDIDGLRELAATQSPATVDELPLARVLVESAGLPGPAREAIREWTRRIEAEREAVSLQQAALPAQRSDFVGRVHELEASAQLLRTSRLLTLVGAPGTGKTRLALQLARDQGDEFEGDPFFVPLAAVDDPRFVGSAIARSMQLRETGELASLEVVKAYLSKRRALLVLDNFEHLLDASAQVGELLDAAPRTKVIVTSRSLLGLSGEQVYTVPPLGVPPVTSRIDAVDVGTYDSVKLFVERARAADPDFGMDATNAATIAAITAALDGLPLAIELAAARVRSLTPGELLERLERRLRLLTGGPVDGANRHRTMRGAIAWSYELLTKEEQSLLRRLGSFRGGFTLDAAARLAGGADWDVIDGIDSLLAKSLIYRSASSGKARYAMLETIREYSIDALDVAGELDGATAGHARLYAELAAETAPQLEGEASGEGVERLALEIDNIRGALEYALATGDADLGMSLAASIWRFWQSLGQLEEGSYWLDRVLSLEGGTVVTRAEALSARAGLSYWQGDFPASRAGYVEARDLYGSAGERLGEAESIYSLSMVATLEGDLDAAEQQARAAKAMFEDLGAEAKVGEALMALATATWSRGDLVAARELWESALDISLRLKDRALAASQLIGVAGVAFQQGDPDEALRTIGDALEMAIGAGNTHTQIFALDAIASFVARADPVAAVELCSAAASLRIAHGGGWTLESFGVDSASTAVVDRLGPSEIEAARQHGADDDLEGAIHAARVILQGQGVDSKRLELGV